MRKKINYNQGTFWFNGQSSKDYGVVIASTPSLDRPTRKYNTYTIPGRSGDIVEMLDAYNNIDKQYEIWAANDVYNTAADGFEDITAWLYTTDGYARLEDDFEPEIFRLAYFVGPMTITNELNLYGTSKITFNCRPERYLKSGEKMVEVTNEINNPTKFTSKPLIKVTGTGKCTITIGTRTMTIDGLADYIYIDCDSMDAYRQDAENKNNMISGDFPLIDPGKQTIATTGNITKVEIMPRWYTI